MITKLRSRRWRWASGALVAGTTAAVVLGPLTGIASAAAPSHPVTSLSIPDQTNDAPNGDINVNQNDSPYDLEFNYTPHQNGIGLGTQTNATVYFFVENGDDEGETGACTLNRSGTFNTYDGTGYCPVANTSGDPTQDEVEVYADNSGNTQSTGGSAGNEPVGFDENPNFTVNSTDVVASSTPTINFYVTPVSVQLTPAPTGHTTPTGTCAPYTVTALDGGAAPAFGPNVDVTITETNVTSGSTPLEFCDPGVSGNDQVPVDVTNNNTQASNNSTYNDTLVGVVNPGSFSPDDGKVTFGIESTQAGSATVSAVSADDPTVASANAAQTFTGANGGGNGNVSKLVLNPPNYNGYDGHAAQYTVTAEDSSGNPVQGAQVMYQIQSGPDAPAAGASPVYRDCGGLTNQLGQVDCSLLAADGSDTGGPTSTTSQYGTDNIVFYVNVTNGSINTTPGPDNGEPQTPTTATFNPDPPSGTAVTITCPTPVAGGNPTPSDDCTVPLSQNAVTFTAHVTEPNPNSGSPADVPLANAYVDFSVDTSSGPASGTNATVSPLSGQSQTNADGDATFAITDSAPHSGDVISVTAVIDNAPPDTADVTYGNSTPSSFTLMPSVETVTEGGTVTLIAKVVDQFGAGVSGQSISYTVSGRNTIPPTNVTTGADGTATISYPDQGTNSGFTTDTVTATDNSANAPGGGPQTATIDYTTQSTTAGSIVLDVSGNCNPSGNGASTTNTNSGKGNATNAAGIQVCALVKNSSGTVLAGKSVTFSVSQGFVAAPTAGGGNPGPPNNNSTNTVTVFTDNAGVAHAYVTSSTSGVQTVTATADSQSATGTVTYAAATARNITLSPTTATIAAGNSQIFTATVTDVNGNPDPGVVVTFSKAGPGNFSAQSSTTVTTNSAGQALVTLDTASSDSGSGSVTASLPTDATTQTSCNSSAGNPTGTTAGNCSATSTYTVGGSQVAHLYLYPQPGQHQGQTENIGAVVKNTDGSPAADVVVRFTVSGANSASGSAETNSSGDAFLSYDATHAGHDTINAYADVNDDGAQQTTEPSAQTTATIASTAKPPAKPKTEKPSLSLSSPSRGDLKVRAKTHPSLSNRTVHFYRIDSNGVKHLIGSKQTNSSGVAKKTLHLTPGKTYKVVARVVGLSSSKYHSKYSSSHSKKVHS